MVTAKTSSIPLRSRAGRRRAECASLIVELLVAMAILVGAVLPIAYSITSERKLARAYYQRAVAMELVDGELETLAAGGWHNYPNGSQDYIAHGLAITNLPPGKFLLQVRTNHLRLEWRPAIHQHGGPVVREVTLP